MIKKLWILLLIYWILFWSSIAFEPVTKTWIKTWIASAWGATYYVDSSGSSFSSCATHENSNTPCNNPNSIIYNCSLSGGDVVKIKGTFTSALDFEGNSGSVVKSLETTGLSINNASTFTFNTDTGLSSVDTDTDWLLIYDSFKGNAGAFDITAVNVGNKTVTVNTSDLPGGTFVAETSAEPGNLRAAVIRPIIYEAWDTGNLPTWNCSRFIHPSNPASYVVFRYLESTYGEGEGAENWGAILWSAVGTSQYIVFDHIIIKDAGTAYGIDPINQDCHYFIIQHCAFTEIGHKFTGHGGSCTTTGSASDEVVYGCCEGGYPCDCDYMTFMYNELAQKPYNFEGCNYCLGPQGSQGTSGWYVGDILEIKGTCDYCMAFGNYLHDGTATHESDAPLNNQGQNTRIFNNYVTNIHPVACDGGWGFGGAISSMSGGNLLVCNNVVNDVGHYCFSTGGNMSGGAEWYNNTCYDADEGVFYQMWNPSADAILRNTVAHMTSSVPFYIGTTSGSFVHTHNTGFGISGWGSYSPSTGENTSNPGLTDPANGDFSIDLSSNAKDTGTDLSSEFSIDHRDASSPGDIAAIEQPAERTGTWDRGAFEYSQDTMEKIQGATHSGCSIR